MNWIFYLPWLVLIFSKPTYHFSITQNHVKQPVNYSFGYLSVLYIKISNPDFSKQHVKHARTTLKHGSPSRCWKTRNTRRVANSCARSWFFVLLFGALILSSAFSMPFFFQVNNNRGSSNRICTFLHL